MLILSALCSPLVCAGQAPDATQPPPGQRVILTVQGRGSQIYSCQPVAGTFQWTFQAPVARLFDTNQNEVGTHGDGPIWSYQDSSSVQGVFVAKSPSPDPGSIPWLLLKAVSPQRTGLLTAVSFIRRSDTHGGLAPAAGCDPAHKGELARVPYTATYNFFASTPAAN